MLVIIYKIICSIVISSVRKSTEAICITKENPNKTCERAHIFSISVSSGRHRGCHQMILKNPKRSKMLAAWAYFRLLLNVINDLLWGIFARYPLATGQLTSAIIVCRLLRARNRNGRMWRDWATVWIRPRSGYRWVVCGWPGRLGSTPGCSGNLQRDQWQQCVRWHRNYADVYFCCEV